MFPDTPTQEDSKGKLKIILALIVLVVIGISGYFVFAKKSNETEQKVSIPDQDQPTTEEITTDDREGGKTYKNDQYNFEIKFSEEWSFFEETKEREGYVNILTFYPYSEVGAGDSFIGSVGLYKNVANFEEWFNNKTKQDPQKTQGWVAEVNSVHGEGFLVKEDISWEYRDVVVNGFSGKVQVRKITGCPWSGKHEYMPRRANCYFFGSPQGYIESWYLYHQNAVLLIDAATYAGPINIDQIISSLKFTN